MALLAEQFIMQADEEQLKRYKSDLKCFQKLRRAVKPRYAEAIDYRDYEPRIKKLLDTHIQANEVTRLNDPVNMFDDKTFSMVKMVEEERGIYRTKTTAARADIIAHEAKRTITESMDKDPAFYEKFSTLIQDAMDGFRNQRISYLDYSQKVSALRDKVANTQRDDVPYSIRDSEEASAYFGAVKLCLTEIDMGESRVDDIAAETALAIKNALKKLEGELLER